ncbi:hypothetical protein [Sedimentitalea nanhaiensis]|uniref:Uncharacterized protein n=1 Tax=Sedimentitalea nanhaiensis TaxID=999627 RepID=A0A1I7DFX8_9RHOB|nr:hypothetical protein [Sedimentitalea nanhaiensis]SFU10578.1 hypothetical protein SAMN05216236_12747 [Sedimentitalea nanhaiensis]
MGRKSLTWVAARIATDLPCAAAISGAASTTAAATSEIEEQSVSRSGEAISGLDSETWLQWENVKFFGRQMALTVTEENSGTIR